MIKLAYYIRLIIIYIVYFVYKLFYHIMYNGRELAIIPENCENDNETSQNWVPKKKHDVLKAKYKCLKKLFQIYDESLLIEKKPSKENEKFKVKRKKVRKSKVDACEGTDLNDSSSAQNSLVESAAPSNSSQNVVSSESLDRIRKFDINKQKPPQSLRKYHSFATIQTGLSTNIQHLNANINKNNLCNENIFYNSIHNGDKSRGEKPVVSFDVSSHCGLSNSRDLSTSRKRSRSGSRRRKKMSTLQYLKRKLCLSSRHARSTRGGRRRGRARCRSRDVSAQRPGAVFMQQLQKDCLSDNTTRECPFGDCRKLLYGIINYNDHLRLCHLKDKVHVCLYCHEGFTTNEIKSEHEDKHLGINSKHEVSSHTPSASKTSIDNAKKAIDNAKTSTDCSKASIHNLKMSTDKVEVNKIEYFEKVLKADHDVNVTQSFTTPKSKMSPVDNNYVCTICGESFNFRRQMCLHMQLEHKFGAKYSKSHSHSELPPLTRQCSKQSVMFDTPQMEISNVSLARSDVDDDFDHNKLRYDPSTNIIHNVSASVEAICKKTSMFDNIFNNKNRKKTISKPLNWEPNF